MPALVQRERERERDLLIVQRKRKVDRREGGGGGGAEGSVSRDPAGACRFRRPGRGCETSNRFKEDSALKNAPF